MEEDSIAKESAEDLKGGVNLMDSPYVGGNKMSSSLKDRLKRSRMHSSPLSRPSSSTFSTPVAPRSIQFSNFNSTKKDSLPLLARQEGPNAMHESCDEEEENVFDLSDVICENNFEESDALLKKDFKASDTVENTKPFQETNLKQNEIDGKEQNPVITSVVIPETKNSQTIKNTGMNAKISHEPFIKVKEDSFSNLKHILETHSDKPNPIVNQTYCLYSKEDIENTNDLETLQTMYSNLKKQSHEHEETLRKLKLVQQHYTKNNPDALTNLTTKWLKCAQLSLKRLYDLMPEPQSVSFLDFLTICQVDLNLLKYDSENDVFL